MKKNKKEQTTTTNNPGRIIHKKAEIDGYIFDSKLEANRYKYLKQLQEQGIISKLAIHPAYELQAKFTDNEGVFQRAITYVADFEYFKDNFKIVEDVKSDFTAKNETFKIKKKLFKKRYPKIIFRIVLFDNKTKQWKETI